MVYSCITDIGLVREKNQDSYLAIENKYGDFLAIVADGIGGGKAGEVASGEVIKYFNNTFKESGPFSSLENIIDFLEYHLNKCNEHVLDLSKNNSDYSGMGTTLTGVLLTSFGNIVFNCGDSRAYGLKENKIYRLTTDHTLVNQMLEKGQITYEESLNHPKKHYLVRAIGIFNNVKFDVNKVDDYDYFLICSDGLHGYVDDNSIGLIIYSNKTIDEKVIDLKDAALLQGGYDNITCILIGK